MGLLALLRNVLFAACMVLVGAACALHPRLAQYLREQLRAFLDEKQFVQPPQASYSPAVNQQEAKQLLPPEKASSDADAHTRMLAQRRSHVPLQVAAAFDKFDVDHSGCIDRRELRSALTAYGLELSSEGVAQTLRRYDDRPDGALDLAEFGELVSDLEAGLVRSSPPAATPDPPPPTVTPPRTPAREPPCDDVEHLPPHSYAPPSPGSAEGYRQGSTHLNSTFSKDHRDAMTASFLHEVNAGRQHQIAPPSPRRVILRRGGSPSPRRTPPSSSKQMPNGKGAQLPDAVEKAAIALRAEGKELASVLTHLRARCGVAGMTSQQVALQLTIQGKQGQLSPNDRTSLARLAHTVGMKRPSVVATTSGVKMMYTEEHPPPLAQLPQHMVSHAQGLEEALQGHHERAITLFTLLAEHHFGKSIPCAVDRPRTLVYQQSQDAGERVEYPSVPQLEVDPKYLSSC